MKFSLYFVGFEKAEDIPADEEERTRWMFSQKATVELTQYGHANVSFVLRGRQCTEVWNKLATNCVDEAYDA